MKRAWLLVFVAALGANCASRATLQTNQNAAQTAQPGAQPTTHSAKPATADSSVSPSPEQEKNVPAEFKGIDFKNFSYPTSLRKRAIQLKDGNYEQEYSDYTGGDTFDYKSVDYADVTGDGKKEAIVQLLRVSCGASCDGGSHLFYFYSARRNRPALFWRIESGSAAYECGLKSFILDKQTITLEVFRKCNFAGNYVDTENRDDRAKFYVKFFTRFIFKFDGNTFGLKGKKVFPYPDEVSTKNLAPEIRISDD